MKIPFVILIASTILVSCNFDTRTPDQMMKELREDFAKDAEINNAKILAWENLRDSIYKISETNAPLAFSTIDKLIAKDTSLDVYNISELHFIKGDIYYRIDSLQKAVVEFTASGQTYQTENPKNLAARAGAYIKLKNFKAAYSDLKKASAFNYDYDWYLGNYYEIIDNRDSAIILYNRLYLEDTVIYRYCKERITELKKSKPVPLKELIYRDRKRVIIYMKGVE